MTNEKTTRIQLKWVMGTTLAAALFVSLGTVQPTASLAKAEAKPEARYAAKAEAKPEARYAAKAEAKPEARYAAKAEAKPEVC